MENTPIIDPTEGPCSLCAGHEPGHCDACGKALPVYEQMGGNGYQSPRPTHRHLVSLGGIAGKEAVFGELCRECYRKAWTKAYPGKKAPV